MSSLRATTFSLTHFLGRRAPLAVAAGVVWLALSATGPAHAQNTQNTSGQQISVDVAARMQARIAELERLVQDLTGRVEEAQYETRRLNERLERMAADNEFRFNRLDQGAGGATSVAPDGGSVAPPANPGMAAVAPPVQTTAPAQPNGQPGVLGVMPRNGSTQPGTSAAPQLRPPGGAPAAAGGLPAGTPEEQYNYAFGLLRQSQFADAEGAFTTFIKTHPQHELAGNAQYWLGETYYARGDYKQAAVSFLDGYRSYPKSAKAPDNLLKLGLAMGNLGKTAEACASFQRMATEYPQAADFLKRRAAAERDRLACK